MAFSPIAIVGQGCVLPGALDPDSLWHALMRGEDLLSRVPAGAWRGSHDRLLQGPASGGEGCLTDRGGFVTGFDKVFDPAAYRLDRELLLQLDALVRWICHAGGQTLADAGIAPDHRLRARTGAIFGNLSYPTVRLAEYAENIWLGSRAAGRAHAARPTHPLNRFSSGLPAHLLCEALGLGAGGFALDAACASSLYAIKLACDWLHDGRADAMLAGGVNAIEGLTLHAGFTALGALSPSGRSRPFHAAADGLVPSEGAAFLLLKRLADAEADGNRILGVIRGIGLSNDGRASGILVPDRGGQERAMRTAYREAGLTPRDITLLECHATGTLVGDATEIASTGAVFDGCAGVRIGAAKSNLGHLVTASGAVGLMKLLAAIRHRRIPPTIHLDRPIAALADSPFRVVTDAEAWDSPGPLRAAISSFGFGGNNAHVIVEEWQPQTKVRSAPSVHALSPRMRVAIVGMAAQVADGRTLDDMRAALRASPPLTPPPPSGTIELPAHGLGIPPNDVEKLLPQQLLALKVARDALAPFRSLPKERMSVVIGMGCDPEACRLSLRLRLPDLLPDTDLRDQICPRVDAAMIVGCMPNIPANRIGRLFDVHGPTFTVSAEELSGIRALEVAARDLASGEADLAVAGAVDLSVEPVHGAAADASLPADRRVPGDAACAFVLKREIDALRDGDPIYAVLDPDYDGAVEWDAGAAVRAHFGHAHAASGALEVMAAALAISDGVLPRSDRRASPWIPDGKPRALAVTVSGLGGARSRVVLHQSLAKAHGVKPGLPDTPDLFVYHGRTIAELASALAQDRRAALPLPPGPRLAFAATPSEMPNIRAEAGAFLARHRPGLVPETISSFAFAEDAVPGEIAFVFTGAAAAYRGMGADLLAAAPELADSLGSPNLPQRCGWIYESERGPATSAFAQLCGTSFLSQVHAQWTMQILGIRPQAAIGLSSGETNSLVALGAWNDFDALLDDIESERLYETHISGDYAAPREHWKFIGRAGGAWANYAVRAPVADVEAALRGEPTAYILIVSSPTEVLLGGEAAACRRVICRLKRADVVPLDIGVACHTPAIMPCRELWHRLHRRATRPVPGVRFYSNAHGAAYAVSSTAAADALLLQAMRTVDFPRTINRAWEDGVRIFIEHGPRAQCSRWIGETLGQRPHLAIPLDSGGGNSLRSALQATARLIVAGVPVNLENVHTLLAPAAAQPQIVETTRSYPAHRPRLNLAQPTSSAAGPETMAPAPALASVLEPVMLRRAATVSPVASPAATFASAVVEMHRAMTQQHLAYVANAG
jgi:acyl transferase domain-containing protein